MKAYVVSEDQIDELKQIVTTHFARLRKQDGKVSLAYVGQLESVIREGFNLMKTLKVQNW